MRGLVEVCPVSEGEKERDVRKEEQAELVLIPTNQSGPQSLLVDFFLVDVLHLITPATTPVIVALTSIGVSKVSFHHSRLPLDIIHTMRRTLLFPPQPLLHQQRKLGILGSSVNMTSSAEMTGYRTSSSSEDIVIRPGLSSTGPVPGTLVTSQETCA